MPAEVHREIRGIKDNLNFALPQLSLLTGQGISDWKNKSEI